MGVERRGAHLAQAVDRLVHPHQVVLDVHHVGPDRLRHQRGLEPVEPLADVEQRVHGAPQREQLAAQVVELLGRLALGAAVEDVGLDRLEAVLERLDDREVLVDHEVEQRIEDEAGTERQALRLRLAGAAQPDVRAQRAMAHGHHVARAGEDVGLAELELAVAAGELRRPERHEDRVAVALELGALVRPMGVLDRQVVQPEGRLHPRQQLLVRLVEADPDEALRVGEEGGNLFDRHRADPDPPPVGDRVDDAPPGGRGGLARRRDHVRHSSRRRPPAVGPRTGASRRRAGSLRRG